MTQKQLIDQFCEFRGKCTTDDVVALNFAYEMLAPRWISVEEELPPMRDEDGLSDKVLTHSIGGGIYLNRYNYGHNRWDNPYVFNVTHWIPIPQAPESGSSEIPNYSKEGGEE